ncbi:ATPase PAAT [Brienomyrus brachyistius]|uniref:ATPase PAAT n=1 Tax=Brienomyrus brachyistius TaxID=42636 RepID=UPI0020B27C00|nr:ATPase PAAT [Brienomyrus brachyistius]
MASESQMSRSDALVSGQPSWAYGSAGTQLSDIMQPVRVSGTAELSQLYTETSVEKGPVYLVQEEGSTPCLLSLRCPPECRDIITSVLVVSEARTMEVYSGTGEYCGTCRGEPDPGLYLGSAEERDPLYKKHLILETPSPSCEVKLLSLGGRTRVGVSRIVLGLKTADTQGGSPPALGPGIDLRRVQAMVGSMDTALSPGAQSLMDLVQFQQQSKMDALGGFLPLLMGGGSLASVVKGAPKPGGGGGTVRHMDIPEPAEGGVSQNVALGLRPQPRSSGRFGLPNGDIEGPELARAVSSLLNGHPGENPDLLSALQAVCGKVGGLHIEDDAQEGCPSAGPRQEHSCCRSLEQALEKQLQDMERRLTQHIDQRLDSLQQGLERTLLAGLHTALLPRAAEDITSGGCHCSAGLLNGES